MVNFSANNLVLISTQTRNTFTRFIMRDQYTKRTYLLYDFEKSHQFERGIPYVVTGKINSANNQLFLVLETSRPDKKCSFIRRTLEIDVGCVLPPEGPVRTSDRRI